MPSRQSSALTPGPGLSPGAQEFYIYKAPFYPVPGKAPGSLASQAELVTMLLGLLSLQGSPVLGVVPHLPDHQERSQEMSSSASPASLIQSVPKTLSLVVQRLLTPWTVTSASSLSPHLHVITSLLPPTRNHRNLPRLSSNPCPRSSLMIEGGFAWFPASGVKYQKGVLEVSFCSLEEFDDVQQVDTECLLGARSLDGPWAPRGVSGLGQFWSPSPAGPTDTHS